MGREQSSDRRSEGAGLDAAIGDPRGGGSISGFVPEPQVEQPDGGEELGILGRELERLEVDLPYKERCDGDEMRGAPRGTTAYRQHKWMGMGRDGRDGVRWDETCT
jgi:hypothetical protein